MNKGQEPDIRGEINADYVELGRGCVVDEGAVITGKHGKAGKVLLGDFCYIGIGVRIMAPEFRLGDYSKLHAYSYGHGEQPLRIGRNCWFGGNVVLDSMGGLDIDDDSAVGAQSHIWSHIQFGDIVEGCKFHSHAYTYLGRDVWIMGHCSVSPGVRAGDKSMALPGSVVTKHMMPNHIYAGVPAKDVTEKIGTQFRERKTEEKRLHLQELIDAFTRKHPEFEKQLLVVTSRDQQKEGVTCFDVSQRTYSRTYSDAEVAFLKAHVPLIKFRPEGCGSFIV